MTCIILRLCIFFTGDDYFQNKINSLMSLDLIWHQDCNINKNGIAVVKISHEKYVQYNISMMSQAQSCGLCFNLFAHLFHVLQGPHYVTDAKMTLCRQCFYMPKHCFVNAQPQKPNRWRFLMLFNCKYATDGTEFTQQLCAGKRSEIEISLIGQTTCIIR